MKFQLALGTLVSLFMAANAAPTTSQSSELKLSGSQLQSLASVLNVNDVADTISCTVAYSLALSTTGPPFTITLATLDLSNCTYTTP